MHKTKKYLVYLVVVAGLWFSSTMCPFTLVHLNDSIIPSTHPKGASEIGTMEFSTLLGCPTNERGRIVRVDNSGNIYIMGYTDSGSTTYPTTPGVINETGIGNPDVFISKISPDGKNLIYSTLLGGSDSDLGYGMTIDNAGCVYITGYTIGSITNFPTTPGANDTIHGGDYDAFICKLNADGTALEYSTFFGGSSYDIGFDIVVDDAGYAYVVGFTMSTITMTPGAYDVTPNGGFDVFVCKVSPDGSNLEYATYIGGGGTEYGYGIAVDDAGCAYITGYTANNTNSFPTTSGVFDQVHNGNDDAFLCKLSADGSSLLYSTFIGGSGHDRGFDIEINNVGEVYLIGETKNDTVDFPTTSGVIDESHNGDYDMFLCKISASADSLIYSTLLGGNANDYGIKLAIDSSGNAYCVGFTEDSDIDFPTTSRAFDETHNGDFDAYLCKINGDGTELSYSTVIGGSSEEKCRGIWLDAEGAVYVIGTTNKSTVDFPTTSGVINETNNGGFDAFLFKMTLEDAPAEEDDNDDKDGVFDIEDLYIYLIIIGIVVIGVVLIIIYKQKKKAQNKTPDPSDPEKS